MIPDYCVRDIANTGATIINLCMAVAVCILVGAALLFAIKRGNKTATLALFLVFGLVGVGVLSMPTAFAGDATTKACPDGYHYEAKLDKNSTGSTKVAGYFRSTQPDDVALVENTNFVLAADGSTGLSAKKDTEFPNWDIARKTLRTYMGADSHGMVAPENVNNSPYAKNVYRVLNATTDKMVQACKSAKAAGKKPAAVFDADDTTLFTYSEQDGYMNISYTPQKQHEYLSKNFLPATPGMVDVVKKLHSAGCEIVGLTGRDNAIRARTIENLKVAGYVDEQGNPLFTDALYFTKFAKGKEDVPAYFAPNRCDRQKKSCGNAEFKYAVREYLENVKGYTIVANYGDQWSDLQGAFAQHVIKIPNAAYYLPTYGAYDPALKAIDEKNGVIPPSEFHIKGMKPDGSLGAKEGVSDTDLANMDILKATIRNFYNAKEKGKDPVDGSEHLIANTQTSNYITDAKRVLNKAKAEVVAACTKYKNDANKPAIVIDADDTSLWMYDMEEWLEFTFSVDKQTEYLKTNPRPQNAVPGMVEITKAASAAGCKVIGLTGRSDDLREVTLETLKKAGYTDFTPDLYFTKTSSKRDKLPSYVKCAKEKCTTIEFKSSVRRHIEEGLGYHIVGNFGDQYSDLIGGYTDANYKIPNPTYYLP